MRGRKPKPVEQRVAEGNPGKRPLPEPVQLSDAKSLRRPPDHLPDDGKRFWIVTVPILEEVGMLDGVDSAALEMAATAYARFRGAQRQIELEGAYVENARGGVREHPACATERQYMATYLRFAEQYGLTAVARTRLGLAELERKSMADQMREQFGVAGAKLEDADGDEDEEVVDAEVVA